MHPRFKRYIGIDYSGAATPNSSRRPARANIGVVGALPNGWSKGFPTAGRTADQQDAYATAEWLRRADRDGSLEKFLSPQIEPHERWAAENEGWILGVV